MAKSSARRKSGLPVAKRKSSTTKRKKASPARNSVSAEGFVSVAEMIIEKCKSEHPTSKTDCKGFLYAVARHFFGDDVFKANGALPQADMIIGNLRKPGSGWSVTTRRAEARQKAASNLFVVAGMTSKELTTPERTVNNGHVAVVVDLPPESGHPETPRSYAGSNDYPPGRIAGDRLSLTFPATKVSAEAVSYFFRQPTRTPGALTALSRRSVNTLGVRREKKGKAVR